MYTNLSTQKSASEGPNFLVGSRGSDWKLAQSWASGTVPYRTPPPHTAPQHSQPPGLLRPGKYLRLCPLLHNRYTKTKNGPNERTDQSFRKNKLDEEETANVSDAEFKTWVIRILTELVEYGRKIEEKAKAMKSEIKEPTVTRVNWDSNRQFGAEGRKKHSTRTEWRNKN